MPIGGGEWDDLFRGTTHSFLEYTGKPVRISTRVQVGTDPDYGDPIVENHHTETVAEVVYRGTPQFSRRYEGVSQEIDAVAWIKDDVAIDIGTEAEPNSTREASRLRILSEIDGGQLLTVYRRVDERNGKVRLHCVNRDE